MVQQSSNLSTCSKVKCLNLVSKLPLRRILHIARLTCCLHNYCSARTATGHGTDDPTACAACTGWQGQNEMKSPPLTERGGKQTDALLASRVFTHLCERTYVRYASSELLAPPGHAACPCRKKQKILTKIARFARHLPFPEQIIGKKGATIKGVRQQVWRQCATLTTSVLGYGCSYSLISLYISSPPPLINSMMLKSARRQKFSALGKQWLW